MHDLGGNKEDIRWLLWYIYNNNTTLWLILAYFQD
jgi:hypothetical protein